MRVFAGFLEHLGRLVHASAQVSDLARARHRTFLITRFGLFALAMVGFLASVTSGYVPGVWETLAVAWLTVPFMAATLVSRTGRLDQGEAACVAAWIGLALTTTLGGGTSLVGGCILLLIAPLEATVSGRRSLVNRAVLAAVAGASVLEIAQLTALPHPVALVGVGDAVVALPALLFVVVQAYGSLALQQHRQHLAAFGNERYRVLSEAIGDLVLRYERGHGIVTASHEAEPLFGLHPQDLLGRGFLERVHVGDRPAFLTLFADAADTTETVSARLRIRVTPPSSRAETAAAATFTWVEIRARRSDRSRRPAATLPGLPPEDPVIVALVRDITAQVDHEHAIETAKQEAERLNIWKDGFLANVSHELRTPLNAIIGFSEMLGSDDLAPRDREKQRDYARIITSSGQHLLSVVNSLLDISKIEAGRFAIDPEPFALDVMVRCCCDMISLKAEQAGVAITCDMAPDLGEVVADKRACKQIIINLLSNALKFTERGGAVTIAARLDGEAVMLTVADTGVGIAPQDLTRLGDAFFQAASGHDRPYEGTGLGLSVVRGLVGLHGGSIRIASAPGEGTQVSVRLPLDCRTAAAGGGAAKIETISHYLHDLKPLRLPAIAKVTKVA